MTREQERAYARRYVREGGETVPQENDYDPVIDSALEGLGVAKRLREEGTRKLALEERLKAQRDERALQVWADEGGR